VAELPDGKDAGKPAMDRAGKASPPQARRASRPWVTRAEAIATLALAFVFLAWVGVIILRQHQAGRDIHWVHGQVAGANYLVDINRAGAPELTLLPGVGPSKAERIVKWRQEHGPFHSLEELRKAAGISAKELAAIRSLVTLGEPIPEPPSDADYAEPESE
jgi:competence ComEA-like helix-hairpin-helix protein